MPAAADEVFHRLVTGPTVQGWLQGAGFPAELEADPFGDPMITSATVGAAFAIYFFDCEVQLEPRACRSLSFAAGFDLEGRGSLVRVNDWNATRRFGQAYLDPEGDPWLELAVSVEGGMPEAQFRRWLVHWETSLADFVAELAP